MRRFGAVAGVAVILAGAMATRAADTAGAHHRVLTFRMAGSEAPGDNIAVADFYVDSGHQADGSARYS